MRYVNCIVVVCVLFFFIPIAAMAGSLDDPGAPTTAGGGAMNTLEDIYNLINAGTTNVPRTGTFTEPSAGPAPTGHTLTEVYNRAKTSSRSAKTGQTTSYVPGDDGDLEKGVAWPNPRFTDNSNGTVTDNLTGLIWLKKADYNSITPTTGTATWADALSFCNALQDGKCGLTDGSIAGAWRLPNVKELHSLIDFAFWAPALSDDAGTGKWTVATGSFTDVGAGGSYWSSTTDTNNTGYAWGVDLNNGTVSGGGFIKTGSHYVWPVRGGQ